MFTSSAASCRSQELEKLEEFRQENCLSFLKIHLQREMSKCFLQQEWGETKLSRLGSNPFGICLSGPAVPTPLLCQNIPSLLPGAVGYPGGNSFNGNGRNGFATPRIPPALFSAGAAWLLLLNKRCSGILEPGLEIGRAHV